ncbi:MAG: PEP-CTERM sorting domain-containing protein [Verrucomicrobiota bacterium]
MNLLKSTVITSALLASALNAQVLVEWSTTGLSGVTSGNLNSTTTAADMQTGILSRGAGFTASSLANGYSSNNLGGADSNTDSFELAITNDSYYQFTISASPDYQLDLDSFVFAYRATSTGARYTQLAYSLDGFETAGVTIGTNSVLPSGSTTATSFSVALDGVEDLQSVVGTVAFRLYGWNETNWANSGGAAIFTNGGVSTGILGTVSAAVPEPSTTAVIMGSLVFAGVVGLRRKRHASARN